MTLPPVRVGSRDIAAADNAFFPRSAFARHRRNAAFCCIYAAVHLLGIAAAYTRCACAGDAA